MATKMKLIQRHKNLKSTITNKNNKLQRLLGNLTMETHLADGILKHNSYENSRDKPTLKAKIIPKNLKSTITNKNNKLKRLSGDLTMETNLADGILKYNSYENSRDKPKLKAKNNSEKEKSPGDGIQNNNSVIGKMKAKKIIAKNNSAKEKSPGDGIQNNINIVGFVKTKIKPKKIIVNSVKQKTPGDGIQNNNVFGYAKPKVKAKKIIVKDNSKTEKSPDNDVLNNYNFDTSAKTKLESMGNHHFGINKMLSSKGSAKSNFGSKYFNVLRATQPQVRDFFQTPLKSTDKDLHKRKLKDSKLKNDLQGKLGVIIEDNEIQSIAKKRKSLNKVSLVAAKTHNVSNEAKYPMFYDVMFVNKFLSVNLTNNQKGRIRQVQREILKGTPLPALPSVIYDKVQSIIRKSDNLSDSDLRKIRVLYNMFNTALTADNVQKNPFVKQTDATIKSNIKLTKTYKNSDGKLKSESKDGVKTVRQKGPKRYVVFVGNLPSDITKEQVLAHFSEIKDKIKDVRLPPRQEGSKSAIAYVELANEIAYEMALSRHHSMLRNKQINVSYSTQIGSKISKAQAKKTSAKLSALRITGQLSGSMSLNLKRSQRRARQRKAMQAHSNLAC